MARREERELVKCALAHDNVSYRRLLLYFSINNSNVAYYEDKYRFRDRVGMGLFVECGNDKLDNYERNKYFCHCAQKISLKSTNQDQKKGFVSIAAFLHTYNNFVAQDLLKLKGEFTLNLT